MEHAVVMGAGYLGRRIADHFNCPVISREEVDATNLLEVKTFFDQEKPEIVINAIGKTGGPGAIGVDWCETHRRETIQSNVVAAVNLCTEASRKGIYFVHLGSGCIYEGDNGGRGFSERDEPNFDASFYSWTKLEAERLLKRFPGLILRIRMPIDDRPHPRNLVDKLIGYSRVIDVKNSMTSVPNMLVALGIMIEVRASGVYNFVNPGTISAAEIMQMYKQIVDPNHKVSIMTNEELTRAVKAKRSNCVLATDKLATLGISLPEIHDAVKKCLTNYKSALGN